MASFRLSPDVVVRPCKFGKGLFACRRFRAGKLVIVLTGEPLNYEQMLAKGDRECDTLQISPDTFLDLDPPGVFINHSCDPNTGVMDTYNLVALRDIDPGEELFFDYSTTMDEDRWEMDCACGTPNCRGKIRDFKCLSSSDQQRLLSLEVVQPFIAQQFLYSTVNS